MNIKIPGEAQYIIDTLEATGFDAYVVGGCVRDSVMGAQPGDWDICTSAVPQQTMRCFEGQHIIKTGLKHGTITLMLGHKPFEITTYRTDGTYSDNRHPDNVAFSSNLKEDLLRRDFTINAMAYNPKRGIADFFGGMADIQKKVIRCVGDADKRLQEDALRIMRALRFASTLGFSVDKDTSGSLVKNKGLLRNISVERIAIELNKLLTGANVGTILTDYLPVVAEIIPELIPTVSFHQNNPYHCYDVFTHTMMSIDNAPPDTVLRLTMLFHDIGKPLCYSEKDGTGHFYGHSKESADIARKTLSRLKYDNETARTVVNLVQYHDSDIKPERKYVKRWLNKLGEKGFRKLLQVKKADAMAQSEEHGRQKIAAIEEIIPILDEIIDQQQCFTLKDLAVNGSDLIAVGVPEGSEVGRILALLLDMVIDETAENDKTKLLEIVKQQVQSTFS